MAKMVPSEIPELLLADLQGVEKRLERLQKMSKGNKR